MTKLGLLIKQESEKTLKDKFQNADSCILVKYSGISASDLNLLRNSLSATDSSLMVIKNSVGKRLFQSYENLYSQIIGPCGIIFVRMDLISASRVVYSFAKEKPNLEIKGGMLKDRILSKEELATLSKIPSLLTLQTQVVIGLKSPIFSLVFSLKQILNKLVYVLGQIKDITTETRKKESKQ